MKKKLKFIVVNILFLPISSKYCTGKYPTVDSISKKISKSTNNIFNCNIDSNNSPKLKKFKENEWTITGNFLGKGVEIVEMIESGEKLAYKKVETQEFKLNELLPFHQNILRAVGYSHSCSVINPFGIFMPIEKNSIPLSDWIRRNKSTSLKNYIYLVRKIGKEILNGLFALENQNIIHGDIKPSNVIVDISGFNVKIIDFGTSWSSLDENRLKNRCYDLGTEGFIAPEVESSDNLGCLTSAVNVYSFGELLRRFINTRSFDQMSNLNYSYGSNRVIMEVINIIKRTTNSNPKSRPKINQLIDNHFFSYISMEEIENTSQVNSKENNTFFVWAKDNTDYRNFMSKCWIDLRERQYFDVVKEMDSDEYK